MEAIKLIPVERFIPACAGNRRHLSQPQHSPPVHPRVCGEQVMTLLTPVCVYGSSPRVRGTGAPAASRYGPTRFIPACAGNRFREP